MEIRKLSFTGSAPTGRLIKKAAAESNLKNVTLELGGKSPLLIFPDADLAKAVPAAAYSILMNSGQACIASSRVYVHESIAQEFITQMKSAMQSMGKSGDPLAEGTLRGPQADQLQFDRVLSFLDHAKEQKVTTALGGSKESTGGLYIEPTIFTSVPEDSKLMREEIFGPVVCINTFTDEAEVLKRANDTEYGLYGSVFTRDVSRALRIAKSLEAGTIGINCTSPTISLDMPFGGFKQSGEGREGSKHVFDHWTELKTVLIAL
jgi:aldehyde dehydrogenase (NAD+)